MLQYILNSSAIWLLSLIVFDTLLKKETFHTYNRFFLLFTLILGCLLPLYSWHANSIVYGTTLNTPVEQVTQVKETIIHRAAPTHAASGPSWLLILYLTGVLAGVVLLAVDIFKLIRLYRNGYKWRQGKWTIVETGKEHTPFSFRKMIFITNMERYSPSQWDIILRHEQQHALKLHIADLVLLQAARILYWFNPLVHLYYQRLLMVHEFQADAVANTQPAQYGKFLIEQSLLENAPGVAHSFNYPNIKNRIRMLTHRTSPYRHLGKLTVLPLLIVFFACCTKSVFNASSPVRKGNLAYYKGNEFLFGAPEPVDTVFVQNPASGNMMMKIVRIDSMPVSMNGKPIYYYVKGRADNIPAEKQMDKASAYNGADEGLKTYVIKNLRDVLSKLDDGVYSINISNIVVDENGKIAYFEYGGIQKSRPMTAEDFKTQPATMPENMGTMTLKPNPNAHYGPEAVNQTIKDEIAKRLPSILEEATFTPAVKDSNPVLSISNQNIFFRNHFKIQNHQVSEMPAML